MTDPNLKLWCGYLDSNQVYHQAPAQPGNGLMGIGPSSNGASILLPIAPQTNMLLMLTENVSGGTQGGCYPYQLASGQLLGNGYQMTFTNPMITKSNQGAPQSITIVVTESSAR